MQKTNFKTRLLALLTAVFMVAMCVPFAAFAGATDTQYQAVNLIFWDVENDAKVCEYENDDALWVAVDKTTLTQNDVASKLPEGYTYNDDNATTEYAIRGGWCRIEVKPVPAPATKKVTYVFWDETSNTKVAEVDDEVAADKTEFTRDDVAAKMPAGYKFDDSVVATTIFNLADRYVRIPVQPDTQEVEIVYYDFKNSATAGKETVNVAADKTTLTAEEVLAHMPAGYKLEVATAENFDIRNGACNVAVVPDTQEVEIVYYDVKNSATAGKKIVTVAANKTALTAEEVAAYMPDGYKLEVATTESFDIVNGYVSVSVVKKSVPATPVTPAKQIKANYFDEQNNVQVAEVALKLYTDKNGNVKFVATDIEENLPKGYKIVNCDYVARDGYVYVGIVKEKAIATTAKANYYDETAKAQVAEKEVATYTTSDGTVKAVATDVSDKCPAGYEIVSSDYVVRDGYVYVSVKKAEVKKAKVNYFDEEAYKQIAEIEMDTYTHGNDSKVKATEVYDKCPDGYEVVSSDYIVRDGYVYVSVKKAKSSSSASSSSSSSTTSSTSTAASSSSNKTTAASTKAAEQKVVKAAAAPANTTKVLPKTGASNVAPLLGGSLAVVALLMGYGVYSLVLRKKD